ncbi:u1 small nuclear ribonucleoprotein component snu71 [Gossypium arboreum]|uniref:U1 small nuclear ribonucleoprotein component snu71 n=1 Tax=Gossypium arboreum TaxID=29729 RepID=A0A0B0NUL7_GOSAR|nr:u1 small nuclear ribonucleoprotein component snu71 [Gossypium arboreum]
MHFPFICLLHIKTTFAYFHSIYYLPKHTIFEYLYTTKTLYQVKPNHMALSYTTTCTKITISSNHNYHLYN